MHGLPIPFLSELALVNEELVQVGWWQGDSCQWPAYVQTSNQMMS